MKVTKEIYMLVKWNRLLPQPKHALENRNEQPK